MILFPLLNMGIELMLYQKQNCFTTDHRFTKLTTTSDRATAMKIQQNVGEGRFLTPGVHSVRSLACFLWAALTVRFHCVRSLKEGPLKASMRNYQQKHPHVDQGSMNYNGHVVNE